jgi:ribosomal-protein-alanine N-acetyltransferase
MAADLPPWPQVAPRHGGVVLRAFTTGDAAMARELSTDPYVPMIGTLSANASEQQALEWVERQLQRLPEGTGFSFAIAESATDVALGGAGLWCQELSAGRATAGYAVVPSARGRGVATDALIALTSFGWTIAELHRIELYIEEWNIASVRTAERVGFQREGLLRSHQEIGGRRRDMLIYAATRDATS